MNQDRFDTFINQKAKLLIIWYQGAACWKMQRCIAFFSDTFSVIVHMPSPLNEQKHGFRKVVLIRKETELKEHLEEENISRKRHALPGNHASVCKV